MIRAKSVGTPGQHSEKQYLSQGARNTGGSKAQLSHGYLM